MKSNRITELISVLQSFPPLIRKSIGILLVILGFFGFLPIIGFWMIPLGLIVLSADYRFARYLYVNSRWNLRRLKRWRVSRFSRQQN